MDRPRLCKDCKWFEQKPKPNSLEPQCLNPLNSHFDPIYGGEKHAWSPSWLRSPAGEHLCGPEAKWFEQDL